MGGECLRGGWEKGVYVCAVGWYRGASAYLVLLFMEAISIYMRDNCYFIVYLGCMAMALFDTLDIYIYQDAGISCYNFAL